MSARKARAAALVKMAHPRRRILTRLRSYITPRSKLGLHFRCPIHAGVDLAKGRDRTSEIVFLSGESMPWKLDDNERRFWIITDEVQP